MLMNDSDEGMRANWLFVPVGRSIIAEGFFQLSKGFRQLVVVGGHSVPLVIAHHEIDREAHHGFHQNDDRLAFATRCMGFGNCP